MPVIMMTPISDMMFSVLPVSNRMSTTPASPGGMAMQDDERIDEGGELRHQHEIDKRDGEDQADAEAREGIGHALHRAAHRDAHAARPLHVLNDVLHLAVDVLQTPPSAAAHRHRSRGEAVVIHLGGRVDRFA